MFHNNYFIKDVNQKYYCGEKLTSQGYIVLSLKHNYEEEILDKRVEN